MSIRKNLSVGLLAVFFAIISCLSVMFLPAKAESAVITNSDFVGLSSKESGGVSESNSDNTNIVLPYEKGSAVYYGDSQESYKVDMSIFDWSLTIQNFEVGQSFTVSFIADTTAMPFDGNAVGVSYVFHRVEDAINVYVLEAKDGKLLEEMKDESLMWAYYKDGEFPEYLAHAEGEAEGFCGGMIGKLGGTDFTGKTLKIVNMVDSASFNGTTFRPVLDGISLGRTIPGTIFDNREIDKQNMVLVLSAGGQNEISEEEPKDAITFTVSTPNEKNTKAYRSEKNRLQLVTKFGSYVTKSEVAIKGELSGEEYAQIIADIENPDLSILRTRDKYLQEQNLIKIRANIELVNEKLETIPDTVNAYKTALDALSELDAVTDENVATAQQAKIEFDKQKAYVAYLQGEQAESINQMIAALNETLLTRGEVHLQIKEYETKVSEMIADATPAKIVAAQFARENIEFDKLDLLDDTNKAAFESRIAVCDDEVEDAILGKAYAVEEYKINLYKDAISDLSASSSVTDFQTAYAKRPSLNLDGIIPSDQGTLKNLLEQADAALGDKIAVVSDSWADIYYEKVYELTDLASLSQQKIDAAVAAAYNSKSFEALCEIADGIGYDLTSQINVLTEYDRIVKAASVRLLLVKFNSLAITEIADVTSLNTVFEAYLEVANSDTTILSETELNAYMAMLESATAVYEGKAIAIINPKLEEFEKAVEVENIHQIEALQAAKDARSQVPDLKYLIVETDFDDYTARYTNADEILRAQTLYYVTTSGTCWTASETETGLRLDNQLNDSNQSDGLAIIEDPLDINGFDFAFEFTEIGRIWKGEDPVGSGKYPQSIYVMNILAEKGMNKDQAQGFSLYFYCNQLDQLEVMIYGAANSSGEVLLAQGVVDGCGFMADPYVPYTVRVRITMESNCYRIWVNSLQMTVYFRDIINPSEDKATHIPGYAEGDEIGGVIFEDGKAYVTFVVFADSLQAEERHSAITIRMIGDKTFGGYVPPLYMVSLELVSGPTKTTYQKGESFDKSGIQMKAIMSDGSVVDVPLNDIKVLGFTSTSKGTKNVSLSYTDASGVTLTKVIKVTIVDAEEEPEDEPGAFPVWAIIVIVVGVLVVAGAVVTIIVLKKKKSGGNNNIEDIDIFTDDNGDDNMN